MKTEEKRKVLKKIGNALGKYDITWAVGASALLYLKGIVPEFGDIDIVTVDEDVPEVKAALDGLGVRKPENPGNRRKARAYLEYRIDGVDVDVMAGLMFTADGRQYEFTLRAEDVKDFALLEGTRIPLQSVEEWETYYTLMGRTKRLRQINESR